MILDSAEQNEKQEFGISVMPFGIITLFSFEQLEKEATPNVVNVDGNTTDVRFEQFEKHCCPSRATPSSIVILITDVHPLSTEVPTFIVSPGIVMLVNFSPFRYKSAPFSNGHPPVYPENEQENHFDKSDMFIRFKREHPLNA